MSKEQRNQHLNFIADVLEGVVHVVGSHLDPRGYTRSRRATRAPRAPRTPRVRSADDSYYMPRAYLPQYRQAQPIVIVLKNA